MPEQPQQKRPVEAASAAPGEQRSAARPKASESGDPAVHKLLGDLETARRNLADVQNAKKEDEDAYKKDEQDAVKALKDLGYDA